VYGQKHIAIPIDIVRVGVIYNLICDVVPPKIHPAPEGIGGRTGIVPFVGAANIGNHLNVHILHHIILMSPGARNAILNGTGGHLLPHHPTENHLHAPCKRESIHHSSFFVSIPSA
jgi:hypothetical protein